MPAKPYLLATLLGVSLLTCSCGNSGSGASLDAAPEAPAARQPFQDFGNYVVHYNAMPTNQLTPETASNYGITRSKSRALLNVVIQKKQADGTTEPTSGKVSAKINNLTGQLKNISLREITPAGGIYYIGDVAVAHLETLNFEIEAIPEGSDEVLKLKFQQQFFTK